MKLVYFIQDIQIDHNTLKESFALKTFLDRFYSHSRVMNTITKIMSNCTNKEQRDFLSDNIFSITKNVCFS